MTYPRSSIVSVEDTPYYHCIGRCVRRSHLCGEDRLTGRSYEHRRAWILERLRLLTGVFAIDLCAYALMSNHYHLVVRIDVERAQGWSNDEVIARWTRIFSGLPTCRLPLIFTVISGGVASIRRLRVAERATWPRRSVAMTCQLCVPSGIGCGTWSVVAPVAASG